MHYRTDAIDFLEPADAFIGRFDVWETADRFDLDAARRDRPLAVSAERPRVIAPGR